MSEHQKHTEFLRQCIRYDESARRQELMEEIVRIQCDARCVRRVAWLMAILTALGVVGLVYPVVLVENFPYNLPQFAVNLILALGLASLISLLAYLGLGMVYRWKLDQRREECRELVAKLLESRLGKLVTVPVRDNRAGEEESRRIREPVETASGNLTGGIGLTSKS
jgi:hypothetical protein